jgi:hypothetical protein
MVLFMPESLEETTLTLQTKTLRLDVSSAY